MAVQSINLRGRNIADCQRQLGNNFSLVLSTDRAPRTGATNIGVPLFFWRENAHVGGTMKTDKVWQLKILLALLDDTPTLPLCPQQILSAVLMRCVKEYRHIGEVVFCIVDDAFT